MHQVVREKTRDGSPFAADRRSFWRQYLARYPEDAELGVKETGGPSNWHAPAGDTQLIVSIYRAKNEVGVFLRGARGVTPAQTQTRLAPHAEALERLVGECHRIGEANHHPIDHIDIDTDNAANWDRAIDWLHARARGFLSAATQLFDGSAPTGAGGSSAER